MEYNQTRISPILTGIAIFGCSDSKRHRVQNTCRFVLVNLGYTTLLERLTWRQVSLVYTSDGSTYSKQVSHFQTISGKSIKELSFQLQSSGMLAGYDWDEDMQALCRIP